MPTFEFLNSVPNTESGHARIFRVVQSRVTQNSVLATARHYGLKGHMKAGSLYRDARLTCYGEGSHEVVVHHASGSIRFHNKALWQVDDGISHVEFDDATAIRIAENFVEGHSIVPLKECKVLRATRLNVAVADRNTKVADHRVIDVGVAFGRVIDGIPVEGLGGKVIVYIDSKRNLTGIDRLWRDVLDVCDENVPLRSPKEAQEEALREWSGPSDSHVSVDGIRFGYYEHGWDIAQRYLQPAYVVSLTIMATEGRFAGCVVARSEYLAAAAANSPEKLAPRRPQIMSQATRQHYSDRTAS